MYLALIGLIVAVAAAFKSIDLIVDSCKTLLYSLAVKEYPLVAVSALAALAGAGILTGAVYLGNYAAGVIGAAL